MKRRNFLKGVGLWVGSLFTGKVLGMESSKGTYEYTIHMLGVEGNGGGIPVVRVPMELLERSKEFSGYEERNLLHTFKQQLEEIS